MEHFIVSLEAMPVARLLVFILGALLVIGTVYSAIATFVLPRAANALITSIVFHLIRRLFKLALRRVTDYATLDRVMALYAPVSLLALLPIWLILISLGYTAMFWAAGVGDWYTALRASESALLTLGFFTPDGLFVTLLEFSEATIGLMMVALLIAYLPSIYAAFSRREALVTLLEVRAGSPPSAVQMIARFNRIHGLARLSEVWRAWETWFAEVDESHTSLAALVYFRSPRPEHNWVVAAGAVLDAAALTRSVVDIPTDANADLCLRAGYLALRHISDFFKVPYHPDPQYPAQPISVTRQEFDAGLQILIENDVPLKEDREKAWADYAGWRVNYDTVLVALADITMAPVSPWSGRRLWERKISEGK